MLVRLAHVGHSVALGQLFIPLVRQNKELLIRRGIVQQLAALGLKGGADAQGLLVGAAGHREVETVPAAVLAVQQGQELPAQQAALGQHTAVLLQAIAEIRLEVIVCDDNGLAEECTALGTAEIEHVAECGVILQAQVIGGARQAVGHAGTVHKQIEAQLIAGSGDVGQLFLIIKGADLGGVGDVHHTGLHLVLVAGVGAVLLHGLANLAGGDFAVLAGQSQALVTGGLDGTGLMHVDVAGIRAEHALPRFECRRDNCQVCLRCTDKKMHIGVWRVAQLFDLRSGLGAVFVLTIAGGLVKIGFLHPIQHSGGGTLAVVTFKTKHKNHISLYTMAAGRGPAGFVLL